MAKRRTVENLGLDWAGQFVRLGKQRDKFTCCDISTRDTMGRHKDMLSMPVRKLALWLATVNPNKVRADLRNKIERYQEECAVALHDYWTKGVAVRGDMDGVVTDMAPSVRQIIGGIYRHRHEARRASRGWAVLP